MESFRKPYDIFDVWNDDGHNGYQCSITGKLVSQSFLYCDKRCPLQVMLVASERNRNTSRPLFSLPMPALPVLFYSLPVNYNKSTPTVVKPNGKNIRYIWSHLSLKLRERKIKLCAISVLL